MSPDNIDHGTTAGYSAHRTTGVPFCQPCRDAHAEWTRQYRSDDTPRILDPTGTHRRLQALAALGHSMRSVSRAAGRSRSWAGLVLEETRIRPDTAATVAAVYERLCMVVPPCDQSSTRVRAMAAANGWAPPLAWDDIDHDPHPPIPDDLPDDYVDEIALHRFIAGDHHLTLSRAEKAALLPMWLAAGLSLAAYQRATGINVHREMRKAAA